MTIKLSFWEDLHAFDPASAESRERFAAKYRQWLAANWRRRTQSVGVEHFEFTDLHAQDEKANAQADDRKAA